MKNKKGAFYLRHGVVALQKLNDAYKMLDSRFGVLTQFKRMTDADIRDSLKTLISIYPNDVEPSIIDEFIQFRYFAEKEESDQSVLQMHKLLKHRNLESTFSNIDIHFRTYLCLPVTSAACERLFSVPKRIRNYHRSTMVQERLFSLAAMVIESDVLKLLDFDVLVTEFAHSHSRKGIM